MAEEGTRIPGESEEGSLSPSLIEQKARTKGWKPRDESDLDEEKWVDAKEFLSREPLFDTIKSLKREIKSINSAHSAQLAAINIHMAKVAEVEFQRAMKQLKAEKQYAIKEEDLQAVEQINEEIAEKTKEYEATKATIPTVNPQQQIIAEEFQEWRSQNKWFEDPETQKEAVAIGVGFQRLNPNAPQSTILEYVTDRIKKIYPEKFQTAKKEPKEPMDNKVESGEGGKQTISRKSKGLSESDLNEQEASVMKTLLRSGALKGRAEKNKVTEKEQYLIDLAEAKGLR